MDKLSRKFVNSKAFERQCKEIGLADEDLREIEAMLLDNPKLGAVIKGTGRLRKMRYSYNNRGKSHCARVCYIDFELHGTIVFVLVFAKKNMENLTKEECNTIHNQINELERSIH